MTGPVPPLPCRLGGGCRVWLKEEKICASDAGPLDSPAGVRHKGPALSSSLMHSESELDSDDAIFTWPDREKGKLLHGQNGSVPNGQTLLKARSPREEIL